MWEWNRRKEIKLAAAAEMKLQVRLTLLRLFYPQRGVRTLLLETVSP